MTLILDPLSSPGCNAHFVALLLDSVIGALDPGMLAPLPSTSAGAGTGAYGYDDATDGLAVVDDGDGYVYGHEGGEGVISDSIDLRDLGVEEDPFFHAHTVRAGEAESQGQGQGVDLYRMPSADTAPRRDKDRAKVDARVQGALADAMSPLSRINGTGGVS